ncbi:MAG TPA: hypothetical protein PLL09_15205 [Flavobacterium sp.]|uniref:hypothetical protein n=1 Tax=unclassified Flavobacterium TaxID=196869 RepID=UPI0025BCE0EA|nr:MULTISPECIES: hypothetical protein [unclassified Flavobacterium]HRE79163.1 hypothetical protein [Flavobacterium sp.]
MSEKDRNTGRRETKNSIMRDLKIKSKKKIPLSHKEILKANDMEEPDIWNLPKE